LDLTTSILALPVVLVLGSLIALLVAVTSRGPVFFFQDRLGRGGTPFRLVKFRTMQIDAEQQLRRDPVLWEQYVRNDFKLPATLESRVTPVGRFLRRTSLDELPQLFNVFLGQMSLVGPRPIVPEELEKYGTDSAAYLSVRPGITGLWQVSGRSGVGYPERVDFDRQYADTWTLALDVKILVRTPITVLRGHGAF
jgi:lipopolysaccharide/colanic/teichoic acid biosynthesis glycosyltransferase